MAQRYDPKRPRVDDNNDFKTANAYSVSVLIQSTSGPTYFLPTAMLQVSIQQNDGNIPKPRLNYHVKRYIDPVNGRRSDSASRYLYPHTSNPNLKILVEMHVKRVTFE